MSSVALKVWPTAVVSNRRMEKTLSVSAFIPSETSGPGRQILAGPARWSPVEEVITYHGDRDPGPGGSWRWEHGYCFYRVELIRFS